MYQQVRGRRRFTFALLACLAIGAGAGAATTLVAGVAHAKGGAPEDVLKGQLFISDSSFPTKYSSVGEFVSRVKKTTKLRLLTIRRPRSCRSTTPRSLRSPSTIFRSTL